MYYLSRCAVCVSVQRRRRSHGGALGSRQHRALTDSDRELGLHHTDEAAAADGGGGESAEWG